MSDDIVCPAQKTRPYRELDGARRCAPSEPEPKPEPAGAVFERGQLVASRYRVEWRLGSSAGAEMYRVFDKELRESVALKAARGASPSAPLVRTLFAEARQTRLIRHPNICRVHDVGVHEPTGAGAERVYFSTLELIDGWRLARVVSEGALELGSALTIARQVLAGLEAAHRAGVQHRRLDSRRVLISGPTADPRVRIVEFGLAELNELTSSEERKAGLALDLHGFGLVLLEMLTGRQPLADKPLPPRGGGSSPVWLPRVLPTRIPPHIAEIVRRCMSPKPGEGFADTRVVLHALSS